ncbi:MAG: DUF2815 family protein [Oscillospiraceae bacterium]|jgi:hypothetical protein|nr:DUF2815 family protein [Oscillospiraceae bacterium]
MAETISRVETGAVCLSYANIFEPISVNGSAPKSSASMIIPKDDTKTIATIQDTIPNVAATANARADL